jgi:DNA-3-methyladenine glycosylase II
MSKPDYWDEACAALSVSDPVMAQLILTYPDLHLVSRGNALMTLARSIVGQQISVKAASSVWAKLETCLGEVNAESILQRSPAELRACGLSERKVLYLKDLAQFAAEGRLQVESWHEQAEEAVIAELVSIKGIGRWTAEMFLMFYLQKPNVYPVDDIGIQKAVGLHYYNNIRPTPVELQAVGERWQPWRTVASWYLWRSLDPIPVSY